MRYLSAAVFLALLAIQHFSTGPVRRKLAVGTAGPAALVAFAAFQYCVAPILTDTVILSMEAVLLFVVTGAVIGSLIPCGSHRAVEPGSADLRL